MELFLSILKSVYTSEYSVKCHNDNYNIILPNVYLFLKKNKCDFSFFKEKMFIKKSDVEVIISVLTIRKIKYIMQYYTVLYGKFCGDLRIRMNHNIIGYSIELLLIIYNKIIFTRIFENCGHSQNFEKLLIAKY